MVSKKLKFIGFLLFFTQISIFAFSQPIKSFSDSSLISQLKTVFQTEPNPAADTALQVFSSAWETGKFTTDERKQILKVANFMYRKRLKTFPVYSNYFLTLTKLNEKSKPDFEAYQGMMGFMVSDPNFSGNTFSNFLDQIQALVYKNLIYTSKSLTWHSTNPKYQFIYDDAKHKFSISIKNTDLICKQRTDSAVMLKNTDGIYDPTKNIWFGQNGKTTWVRNGFKEDEVYAKLRDYKLDLSKTEYSADSVTFVNKNVLNHEILGKLSDKITSYTLTKKDFPLFVSYENDIELSKMLENVNYRGGISMAGKEIIGVGNSFSSAEVTLKNKGSVFLRLTGDKFTFGDKVKTENARVTIYLNTKDSIFHSSAKAEVGSFSFDVGRTGSGSGKSNFFDSYHKIDIDADRIQWPEKDTVLFIFQGEMPDGANFFSSEYFTPESFEKIQMMDSDNPLFAIQRFMRIKAAKEKLRLAADNPEQLAAMGIKLLATPTPEDAERISHKISVQDIQDLKIKGFDLTEFCKFWKKDPTAIKQRLIGLSFDGFVDFNSSTQYITVLPKLYHYTASQANAKDYDIIVINSQRTKDFNAILDLKSLDLMVEGVTNVPLSRAKNTSFIPSDNSVTIRKNRELLFSGRLRSGMMAFYGNNFDFNYENFDVKFKKIDSAAIAVESPKKNSDGNFIQYRLNSTLENLSGNIVIDKAGNKSGKDTTTSNFPVLTETDTSRVYYDIRNKKGKVYDRKKFYFSAYPFKMDSLANLKEKSFKLPGKLYSKSIFPDFEETLCVQPDKSLGFVHKTPKSGFKIFNGKATLSAQNSAFVNTITLSNKGFGGSGEIQWMTMTIDAGSYNFFPDSMSVVAKSVKIDKNKDPKILVEYPIITGDSVDVHWNPNKEKVLCKNLGKPFDLFSEKAKLSGSMNYTTKGIDGNGKLELQAGTFYSRNFFFYENSLKSENTNSTFKALNEAGNTFEASKMKIYLDLTTQKGIFQSRGDSSSVLFPKNVYTANPNHFVWEIGNRQFDIDSDVSHQTDSTKTSVNKLSLKSLGLFDDNIFKEIQGKTRYMSIYRGQDSLRIYATKSHYDGDKNQLTVKDVSSIDVADVTVVPTSDVIIDQGAVIEKLLSTTLKVGDKHTIGNVDINIRGRNEYQASSGTYIYFDENKTAQNIHFDNIVYDKTDKRSEAHGNIKKEQKFALNPYFDYYGDVDFYANHDYLRFYGFAKIIHTCKSTPFWFHFDSYINPDSVYLPLENRLHSFDKTRIFADFMVGTDSVYSYTSFLSNMPRNSESLLSLRDSTDFIFFDKQKIRYRISSLAKLKNRDLPGNYLDLDTKNCIASGEGNFQFDKFSQAGSGDNFGQVKLFSAGNYKDDMPSGKIEMQMMLGIDFFIEPDLMKIIYTKISQNFNLGGVDPARDEFKKDLQQYLGLFEANQVLNEMTMNQGQVKKLPEKLDKTIFFSDLKLRWDQKSKSFKSYGKIGIGAVNKSLVNKYVDGNVEIVKRRGANRINIFLMTNSGEWFFFSYSNGIMRANSSVDDFNNIINKLKDKDRKQNVTQGTSYSYYLGSETMKNEFLKNFESVSISDDDNVVTPPVKDKTEKNKETDKTDNDDDNSKDKDK
jgi:hypothetical protein